MQVYSDSLLKDIFQTTKTIAVVGLSARETQPSYMVANYLMDVGFKVVPVNPALTEWQGMHCFASLKEIPYPIDMVDCFRATQYIPALVDACIEIGAKTIWMQLGVEDAASTLKAQSKGIVVLQNLCIKIEHDRVFL